MAKKIDIEIKNEKNAIKQVIIDFISTLKADKMYSNNIAYKKYVNSLAEGVPEDIDAPWYNNGKILIEPSTPYQKITDKENLLKHYQNYHQDILNEIERIVKKISKFNYWNINKIFDLSSPFIVIEPSPLTTGLSSILYGCVIKQYYDGMGKLHIISKTFPKELDFLSEFDSDEFSVRPMTEEEFDIFLSYEANAMKKHINLIDVINEIDELTSLFKNNKKY